MSKVNSILRLDKQEKNMIYIITLMVRTIFIMIISICKGIIWGIKTTSNIIKTNKELKLIGFSTLSLMDKIENVSSREFEYLIAEIFKAKGYETTITKAVGDYGRDIILKNRDETIFVECKHYKNELIGREICQKLLGSMDMFGVKKGIIVTTSHFHRNAYEVQKMVGEDRLVLWDYEDILECLSKLHPEKLKKIAFRLNNCA